MRKAISLLDDEQRGALLVLVDFGTAVFSAGLVVGLLQALISLVP